MHQLCITPYNLIATEQSETAPPTAVKVILRAVYKIVEFLY